MINEAKSIELTLLRQKLDELERKVRQESAGHTFGDLYGILREYGESTKEDIDAILYRAPALPE